jgi:hypothetical protein
VEAYIAFWVVLAAGVGFLASGRGRSSLNWFIVALLLSPLLGLIILLVMPNELERAEQREADRQRHRSLLEAVAQTRQEAPPVAAPSLPTSSDPLAMITSLAELRDTGLITAEEFDAKKRQLLERI